MAQTLPGRSLCAPGKVRLLESLHIPFTHPLYPSERTKHLWHLAWPIQRAL